MENRPPNWTIIEAQVKVIENYKRAKKRIKPKMERQQTPRLRTQNDKPKTSKLQDDWQRQVESLSIQLKHLTTEPDSPPTTPQKTEQDTTQESFY